MSFKDGAMENIGKLTFFSLIFIKKNKKIFYNEIIIRPNTFLVRLNKIINCLNQGFGISITIIKVMRNVNAFLLILK